MKRTNATRKTSEELRNRIANIILFQISDPRLQMVTVTGADVSKDRAYADIYVSADKGSYEEVEAGFEAAKGRIRSLLARELEWRVTPELRFHIDTTVDNAERIAKVLEEERQWQDSITQEQ